MNERAFELTALAMRYWFIFLIAMATLCALRLAGIARRRARLEHSEAPEQAYVGELLVVKGAGSVTPGERYPVMRDVVVGHSRKCDVCLDCKEVFARHARGELRRGGMCFSAIGRAPVSLRGKALARDVLVRDGEHVCIGPMTFQLTLYDMAVDIEDIIAPQQSDEEEFQPDDIPDNDEDVRHVKLEPAEITLPFASASDASEEEETPAPTHRFSASHAPMQVPSAPTSYYDDDYDNGEFDELKPEPIRVTPPDRDDPLGFIKPKTKKAGRAFDPFTLDEDSRAPDNSAKRTKPRPRRS